MHRMIFGVGTGRCGTYSLSKLLHQQKNVHSTHENVSLPWEQDLVIFWRFINHLQTSRPVRELSMNNPDNVIVANTSWAWINYIDEIMLNFHNPKIICLKRDMESTIDSFMNYEQAAETTASGDFVINMHVDNRFTDPKSKHWDGPELTDNQIDFMYPKYDLPKEEAIAAYWNDYYQKAQYWANKYPDTFKIFSIDSLNSIHGVQSILDHAEIPGKDRDVFIGIKLNTRTSPQGEVERWDGDILDMTG